MIWFQVALSAVAAVAGIFSCILTFKYGENTIKLTKTDLWFSRYIKAVELALSSDRRSSRTGRALILNLIESNLADNEDIAMAKEFNNSLYDTFLNDWHEQKERFREMEVNRGLEYPNAP